VILPSDFQLLWAALETTGNDSLWFVFHRNNLLVFADQTSPRLPLTVGVLSRALGVARESARFVGMLGRKPVWAARARSDRPPQGHVFENMRMLFNRLS